MEVLPAKRQEIKLHRKVFERVKESKWGKFCNTIWIEKL